MGCISKVLLSTLIALGQFGTDGLHVVCPKGQQLLSVIPGKITDTNYRCVPFESPGCVQVRESQRIPEISESRPPLGFYSDFFLELQAFGSYICIAKKHWHISIEKPLKFEVIQVLSNLDTTWDTQWPIPTVPQHSQVSHIV